MEGDMVPRLLGRSSNMGMLGTKEKNKKKYLEGWSWSILLTNRPTDRSHFDMITNDSNGLSSLLFSLHPASHTQPTKSHALHLSESHRNALLNPASPMLPCSQPP